MAQTLTADVKISADADNALEARVDGLYAAASGGGVAPMAVSDPSGYYAAGEGIFHVAPFRSMPLAADRSIAVHTGAFTLAPAAIHGRPIYFSIVSGAYSDGIYGSSLLLYASQNFNQSHAGRVTGGRKLSLASIYRGAAAGVGDTHTLYRAQDAGRDPIFAVDFAPTSGSTGPITVRVKRAAADAVSTLTTVETFDHLQRMRVLVEYDAEAATVTVRVNGAATSIVNSAIGTAGLITNVDTLARLSTTVGVNTYVNETHLWRDGFVTDVTAYEADKLLWPNA